MRQKLHRCSGGGAISKAWAMHLRLFRVHAAALLLSPVAIRVACIVDVVLGNGFGGAATTLLEHCTAL